MAGAAHPDPARRTRWTRRCCGVWGARTSSSRRCWRGRREAGTSAGRAPGLNTHNTTQHNTTQSHFNFILFFNACCNALRRACVRVYVCASRPPLLSCHCAHCLLRLRTSASPYQSHRIAFASSQHVPNLFHLQQSSPDPDPAARPERRAGESERRDHAAAAGAGAGAGRPHAAAGG
jgi:hypothetical protein